jgi:SAM-dependent methyltransferase
VEVIVKDWVHATSSSATTFVRCAKCGHVYQSPRLEIQFGHHMYPSDNALFASDTPSFLIRVKMWIQYQRIAKLVEAVPSDGRIVEVGAGDGMLLLAIRQKSPKIQLTAIDIAFSTQTKSRLESMQIEVTESAAESNDFLENSRLNMVDLVIMNQSIEHLWDPLRTFSGLFEVLKPGGLIVVTTPDYDGYDRKMWKKYWGGWYAPRHLNLFTRTEVIAMASALKMTTVRVRSLVAPVIWCHSLGSFLIDRFPRSIIAKKLLRSFPPALMVFTGFDFVAKLLGFRTSNVEYIFRKSH